MTEFEIRESLAALYSQVSQDSAMFFTLVSAYLVVAYTVGRKLSATQISIINALSGFWSVMLIFSIRANLINAADLSVKFFEAGYSMPSNPAHIVFFAYAYPVMLVLGILATLYFMWSTRRVNSE